MAKQIDFNKHIWEGRTVGNFINELEPTFRLIMLDRSHIKPFRTKEQIKKWCCDFQPYYKKPIKEVIDYFCDIAKNDYGLDL